MADAGGTFGWIKDWIGGFFDSLRSLGAGIAGKVLTALGFHWTTVTYGLPALFGWLASHAGLTSDIANVLSYIKVPQAISMIVSAYVARRAVSFLFGGLIP